MEPTKEVEFVVESFSQLNPTCFELKTRPTPAFEFKAGQFASLVIPALPGASRDLRRAYSIASNPEQAQVDFCIKLVPDGPGSTHLSKLRVGDRIKGFAPFGHFVYKSAPERNVMFIATGTGIAPFRAMIHSSQFQSNPPKKTMCLLGIRDLSELLYTEELERKLGRNVITCLSRVTSVGQGQFKGRVTDYLRDPAFSAGLDWSSWDFYLCGNGAMIRETQTLLVELGVTKEHIFKEAYFQPSLSNGKESSPLA